MTNTDNQTQGLYDPSMEHDACGVGFIANIKGKKSHKIVSDALTILENMEHRGACGCDPDSGDGAGILIQIPHEFFKQEALKLNIRLEKAGSYGVGMLFFPKKATIKEECRRAIGKAADKLGLKILGYRKVPINSGIIGEAAFSSEPDIEQVFIAKPVSLHTPEDFERKLYVLKNYATKLVRETVTGAEQQFYVVSLSQNVIMYKGEFTSSQVRIYFPDLNNSLLSSAFGMIHSRFSTNTFPSWRLAQPFRFIAHNGEINTLKGNLNWFYSGIRSFASPFFSKDEMDMLLPVIDNNQSDSACLDNVVELLFHCGRSLPHVMMMLIPEAWDGNEQMDPATKAFYEYHATLIEPWDGPAAIAFTDGHMIGATLDRNGLRPQRFVITDDNQIIVASEAGVLPVDESKVIKKGRLQPGKMLVVDTIKGTIIEDEEIKKAITTQQPYGTWLENYKIRLEDLAEPRVAFTQLSNESTFKYQQVFGYSREDIDTLIKPMALTGKEAVGSMGTDTPLAVFSDRPQHLANYFKQLFAQVTNPPIDPIRERLVMSLAGFMGNNGNILDEDEMHCHCVALPHPVLSNTELEKIRSIDTGSFQAKTLQTYFKADGQQGSLQRGLERLCRYAEDAVHDGFEVLILSDRAIDSEHAPIPSLLAVSAVHHHLIKKGLRGAVGIMLEAGDVWEVHHFACLIAFGATAVNPYLALATIHKLKTDERIDTSLDVKYLYKNYIKSVNDGLLKIFSKMGISTLQSYHGAQIFEIVGLNKDVIDNYFTGSVSRIGGMGLDDIAEEALRKHFLGFKRRGIETKLLPEGGVYQWKRKGEAHLFNPDTVHLLQHATRTNNYDVYKKYASHINKQTDTLYTIRGLLDFAHHRQPVPLSEVEPVEVILKRFATGAMSFGSISHEAHSTLAIAMNRIGAKSNTGEGGEDELRYLPLADGGSMRSAIKQIASGRFGVTANYLTNADELQIKMAQGAKPGEGGQLPGDKVDEWIAKVRHATPGVGLISPPPHHDIYSIEDLAQLIFDLKNANRAARISVKLVSKAGVGTIAAGVAKAHADVILIAGHDGGTGASPLTSIKHAGLPWELGLAEAQQTLVKNKLRSRVVLQTDGQLKTGKDIAIATLLGAEEWGVATAALVAGGCIMMRKCHLNTCPVGVATQDPELRKLFSGKPEHIVNLFRFIAEELREIMAELGFRTINDMVGRVQFLKMRDDVDHWKVKNIDLSGILYPMDNPSGMTLYNSEKQDHNLENVLDWELVKNAAKAIESKEPVFASFNIKNTDRTTGTILSNEITKKYQSAGLPQNTINYTFTGSAGQSFGAFCTKGISFELCGEANDYVGKGLSGAQLVIYPSKKSKVLSQENIIIGNVALYGATSGDLFVRGQAGERFAVRNSGAIAVVEGVGDHGCEYMTGGRALILGKTGRNFAAGMSGGIAWVYDSDNSFVENCNTEMVDLDPLSPKDEEEILSLLNKHVQLTQSQVAKYILDDWAQQSSSFIKVFPKEYKKVLLQKELQQSAG
ncbi:MAG: glutamate synthase large subunit [Sphingobacteriales bacterium 17-39-43]|uniref:glutamate synthase large subunit n=1 Tax=Daejeonella sp. TaxID=2805397 RepID=UPI000BCC83C5|nr:glutamate synthase large subunit [Daejeonella sp.]OYZ33105.1 MAG: glutamate synthase large subunit [Sphingobacteriales bacterium 16-39-50]OZA26514.1 MAG: glutamate synthase large subunit [Sphingobacteriales bacterium 17-39-43]OZA62130.1 MAG: glutamate synthase large subunit [Sphingobacteriales bacterium 39-40-5]HQS50424.1 glutamate synthase large subunit [Daejeonella sp.]HQT21665.1 glutamate synthase large subunit [Daejeonella sp.]